MLLWDWKPLFANDQEPERSLWPAGRSQNHKEALNIIHACWVVHVNTRSVQKVHPALLYQPCNLAEVLLID